MITFLFKTFIYVYHSNISKSNRAEKQDKEGMFVLIRTMGGQREEGEP